MADTGRGVTVHTHHHELRIIMETKIVVVGAGRAGGNNHNKINICHKGGLTMLIMRVIIVVMHGVTMMRKGW